MNHWAGYLAALPAVQQRAIARFHRISLPRRADADVIALRLRQALCHASTVRVAYAALDADIRAALDDIRSRHRGIAAAELLARYGAIRPLRELRADPRPQSIAEHLLLLGWLIERVDALDRPARWLLPPELRRWLPMPLHVVDLGLAPVPLRPPILRAVATLLLACATRPLAVRADGRLRRATERLVVARLAPLAPDEAGWLLEFTLPLLIQLGLLGLHHGRCELMPAGRRFLLLPDRTQRDRLAAAWHVSAQPEHWLRRQLRDTRGIDWPLLRRRLLAWAAALPTDRLLDPTELTSALAATLGPLADSWTHGYRTVQRVPWRAPLANTIFQAALRGPLAWLGVVAWASAGVRQLSSGRAR
jgi:hypothetical protein